MTRIAPYLLGGLVAVVAMEYGPAATQHLGIAQASGWEMQAARMAASSKGDRAAPLRPAQTTFEVATVEVIGLNGAAIVYRHRDGRELFRTDPLDNMTVVTKGFVLPQVTVRRDAASAVTPVPMLETEERRSAPPAERPRPSAPAEPASMPVGCESPFSPVASPAMAHHLGRCMAEGSQAVPHPARFAGIAG